jgi:hypothetical protein
MTFSKKNRNKNLILETNICQNKLHVKISNNHLIIITHLNYKHFLKKCLKNKYKLQSFLHFHLKTLLRL